jgi:hypothetical protein
MTCGYAYILILAGHRCTVIRIELGYDGIRKLMFYTKLNVSFEFKLNFANTYVKFSRSLGGKMGGGKAPRGVVDHMKMFTLDNFF